MNTFKFLVYAALIVAFLPTACKKDYTTSNINNSNAKIQFLRFTESNCLSSHGLEKSLIEDYYVAGYDLVDNELTLHIFYTANCCPDFSDQVNIIGNTVDIALTAHGSGCYCNCNFNNDFTFLYTDTGDLRIKFRIMDFGQTVYYTKIDTLLQIN